jgi:hypothetical protein
MPSNRAKRLDCGAFTAAFSEHRDGRSGVSAERRHLKKSGKVSGGLLKLPAALDLLRKTNFRASPELWKSLYTR